jgi:hypothetical protein
LKIRAGYDIAFKCFQEVPMLLMLSVHPSRQQDLLTEHTILFSPNVEKRDFQDAFGNVCTRLRPSRAHRDPQRMSDRGHRSSGRNQ